MRKLMSVVSMFCFLLIPAFTGGHPVHAQTPNHMQKPNIRGQISRSMLNRMHAPKLFRHVFNVKDYGAVGDKKTMNTQAFKKAIDAAHNAGGGIVVVPSGTYLTGTIQMESNIILYLEKGATILGSPNHSDFPHFGYWTNQDRQDRFYFGNTTSKIPHQKFPYKALLFGRNVKNVAILGQGTIDGNGKYWWDSKPKDLVGWDYIRPRGIEFIHSRNLMIQGVHIQNPAAWTMQIRGSQYVAIDHVSINNPADSPNTDAMDIDSSQHVWITHNYMSVGDDCITLKAMDKMPASDIYITDNTGKSGHGGVVIGSETGPGVENVVARNNKFIGTNIGIRIKTARGRGSTIKNLKFYNTQMNGVGEPVKFNTHYASRSTALGVSQGDFVNPWTPILKNITFRNLNVENSGKFDLRGLAELPTQGVRFENVNVVNSDPGQDIFDIGNTNNVVFQNVKASFAGPTTHPFLDAEYVNGMDLTGFHANLSQETGTPFIFKHDQHLKIGQGAIPVASGQFGTMNLSSSKTPSDQSVKVSVPVSTNKAGLAIVPLKVDKHVNQTQYLWIKPGEKTNAEFTLNEYQAGTHLVSVGQEKQSLTVQPTSPQYKYEQIQVRPDSLVEGRGNATLLHSSVPSLNEPEYFVFNVQNTGTSKAAKAIHVYVDGKLAATKQVSLDPGQSQWVKMDGYFMFQQTGTHTISIGSSLKTAASQEIYVWNKYNAYQVLGLNASATTVTQGQSVSVNAKVTDTAYGKEYKTAHSGSPVALNLDGKPVQYEWMKVKKGDSETAQFTVDTSHMAAGKHTLSVGGKSVTINVQN